MNCFDFLQVVFWIPLNFKIVVANELDEKIAKTYRENFQIQYYNKTR